VQLCIIILNDNNNSTFNIQNLFGMATLSKWVTDPAHSEIQFKVKHMMITNVKGEFRKFSVEAASDGTEFLADSIRLNIETPSIFTNSDDRDKHLKSADFFDTEHYSEMTFTGASMQKTEEGNLKLKGNLTIKGIKKEVIFDVEFGGINKDPWGNEKAGFSINGKINRKDWGLNWNAALETGGVLVSDEVKLNAELQMIKLS
jgi:polyisoprenoid-binding protein YceI